MRSVVSVRLFPKYHLTSDLDFLHVYELVRHGTSATNCQGRRSKPKVSVKLVFLRVSTVI